MQEASLYSWKNAWLRRSVLFIVGLIAVSVLVGFVWLPARHGDFSAQGIWASICRAAGAPAKWGSGSGVVTAPLRTTDVVLTRAMAAPGSSDAVGLGATIALQCTICHGARGVSEANAPNLAGQYPEVIIKQLADYRNGDRSNAVMQAFAIRLPAASVEEVARYYAYLPKPANAATGVTSEAPALARVGDPMRNIAPCASCHGGDAHKLGAPWLEAMPKEYLSAQLHAFASGARRNDSHAQMRNAARLLTAAEIDELATWYARR